jgi:RNA polymerase sigma factor (sigma-70 family)
MSSESGKELVLTPYAKTLVRVKARQLSRRLDFGRSEREEIQQELWLAVISQADNFDPERGSLDTFIDRVVKTAAAMMVRDRERQKRAEGFHASSLDMAAEGSEDSEVTLAEQLTEDDHYRRLGTERPDPQAEREQAEAIEAALCSMPPEMGAICRRVMQGSALSAANELQTSRRQVRKALVAAREFLESAGIDRQVRGGQQPSPRHT